MSEHVAVGIDIGTYTVKVAIAALGDSSSNPRLLGTGYAESKGLHHGYITNIDEVTKSIQAAIKEAEDGAKTTVRKAYLSAGGVSLEGIRTSGSVIINRTDPEINQTDIERSLKAAERVLPQASTSNRKILHTVPLGFRLDGRQVLGQPTGMKGNKLEVQALFVTYLEQHLNDLIQAVEAADIEVVDVVAAPIAASFVSLTKTQKMAGCVLANIGAETLSIIVYENNIPISLQVFPLGSTDITNDIALGFQIPLEDAEKIKVGSQRNSQVPKRKLEEIVNNRLTDMFKLINAHLEKLGKNQLLPAGIVISGGGSGLTKIEDIAKASLSLPSKIVQTSHLSTKQSRYKDATWAVAYGLCILGLSEPEEEEERVSVFTSIGNGFRSIGRIFKRLLP